MRNIFTPLLLLFVFTVQAQDGTLDPTYGSGGKQVNQQRPYVDNVDRQEIVILPDGKFLQVYAADTTTLDFGLARFNEDGSLDNTFGINGVVVTDFGGDEVPTSITLTSDNKILVAGYRTIGATREFAIARYSLSGVLDNTFDGDGRLTTSIGGSDDGAYAIDEQAGIIVAAGYSFNNVTSEAEFAIVRYLNNGTLDNTFSGDGIQTTSINVLDVIYDIEIQTDGKVVAAGYSSDLTNNLFALARYETDGDLDPTFNFSGVVTTWVGVDGNAIANAVVVDPVSGKIIVAGEAENFANKDFALVRYNSNGSPDMSFDGDGIVTRAVGSGADIAYEVAVQPDGRIIVAGTSFSATTGNDFAVARFAANGSNDPTFNAGSSNPGVNIIDFGNTNDNGYDMAFQGTNIIIAGTTGLQLSSARLINSSPTLPAYFLTFTAVKQNNTVLLNWQTAAEENTSYFEVLRSQDGVNYYTIGEVAAANNSSGVHSYRFRDQQPYLAANFYRIRLINQDRSAGLSKVVVVKFNSVASMEVYPNPVRQVVNLQVKAAPGKLSIRLFDASGMMVRSMELHSQGTTLSTSMDLGNLPKGTYFLRVNEETMKVVKQ